MEIVVVLVSAFLAFEFLEHVVFPLIWVLLQRRKKPVTGPEALEGRMAEVIEWRQREGQVFVNGEYWKATERETLGPGRPGGNSEGRGFDPESRNPRHFRKHDPGNN